MEILLLGDNSTITTTLNTMLQSVDSWHVTSVAEFDSLSQFNCSYDLLIANLEDFETSSVTLITQIHNQLPATPLLVVHSYSNNHFIKPMLNAGATGYIRSDISERDLFEAVKKSADHQKIIIADSTY